MVMKSCPQTGRLTYNPRDLLCASRKGFPFRLAQAHSRCNTPGILCAQWVGAVVIGKHDERRWMCSSAVHHPGEQARNLQGMSFSSGMGMRVFERHWYECSDHCQLTPLQLCLECGRFGGHISPVAKFCTGVASIA